MDPTGLHEHVNERAMAEWIDAAGHVCSLGSVSPVNKEDSGLMLRVGLTSRLEAFVRFSLTISLRAHGRSRWKTLLFILPVETLRPGTFTFTTLKISDAGSFAAGIHEAGLSDGGFILAVQFSLEKLGHVVLPNSALETIRPSTATASSILTALRSLSQALDFTVYVKPSDYARVGLLRAAQHLRNAAFTPLSLELAAAVGADTRPLDWTRCELSKTSKKPRRRSSSATPPRNVRRREASPPPPYAQRQSLQPTSSSRPASPNICVRRSSSCDSNKKHLPRTSPPPNLSSTVPETPPLLVASPKFQYPSAHTTATATTVTKPRSLDPIVARVSLERTLALWLAKACAVNADAYSHACLRRPLRAMGRCARNADAAGFRAARARCAALFFYDPHHSLEGDEKCDRAVVRDRYVADMERLLGWMLGADGDPFADFLAWEDLLALGEAAREAVGCGGGGGAGAGEGGLEDEAARVAEYNRRKGICASRVLAECSLSSPEPE